MNQDPEEDERAAEQVRMGLAGLRIEHKVAEAAEATEAHLKLLRQRFWQRISIAAILTILAGAGIWSVWKKETLVVPPPSNRSAPPFPSEKLEETLPNVPEHKKSTPVASNKRPNEVSAPRYPAPVMRGENTGNKAWKALLDKVWYTDYPRADLVLTPPFAPSDQLLQARDFNNAYVQLQRLERNMPANDTLRFLKGYCLLELGEGAEALGYFEQLEQRQPAWKMQLEWYRGLSLLLTGDRVKALSLFRKIGADPGHSYLQQSKKAIRLLE